MGANIPRAPRERRTACVNPNGGPTIPMYIIVKTNAQLCVRSRKFVGKHLPALRRHLIFGDQRAAHVNAHGSLANADFLESMAALTVDQLTTIGRAHSSPKALLTRPLDFAIASWVMHSCLLRGAGIRPIAPINHQTDENSQFIVSSSQRQPCFSL